MRAGLEGLLGKRTGARKEAQAKLGVKLKQVSRAAIERVRAEHDLFDMETARFPERHCTRPDCGRIFIPQRRFQHYCSTQCASTQGSRVKRERDGR